MSVSRETDQLLTRFEALLRVWNPKINLVSAATLDDFKLRHLRDSLQLARFYESWVSKWMDLGSGGGFPALPLACALLEQPVGFVLVEADQRKATFLRRAIAELGVNATVVTTRIEQMAPAEADIVSARALAPLPLLLSYVQRHLSSKGTALLMKGKTWREEVHAARKQWRFDLTVHESATASDSVILELRNLRAD